MILMALDHVRDFFGAPGVNPTNVAQTTLPLFLTRWVTHICAPTFFLLTGTGAFLWRARHAGTASGPLSRYLLTRGLWLIVLELTVVRCLGYQFNFDYRVTFLVILWALGWAMIALAALVWLPLPVVLGFALATIAGHNLFDRWHPGHPLWTILHEQSFVVNRPGFIVFVAYPLVPWIGVTALGYALGHVYGWEQRRRRALLLTAGALTTVGFVVLRTINGYGDPVPWKGLAPPVRAAISFLNVTKYPPSLLFLMMTLGPALLCLAALDDRTPRVLRPAVTFGRVPLFYFVLHLPLIHLLATILCEAQNGAAHWMFESPDLRSYPFTPPPGWGLPLPAIYALWIGVVAALYPLCVWFSGIKRDSRAAWLKYL